MFIPVFALWSSGNIFIAFTTSSRGSRAGTIIARHSISMLLSSTSYFLVIWLFLCLGNPIRPFPSLHPSPFGITFLDHSFFFTASPSDRGLRTMFRSLFHLMSCYFFYSLSAWETITNAQRVAHVESTNARSAGVMDITIPRDNLKTAYFRTITNDLRINW